MYLIFWLGFLSGMAAMGAILLLFFFSFKYIGITREPEMSEKWVDKRDKI